MCIHIYIYIYTYIHTYIHMDTIQNAIRVGSRLSILQYLVYLCLSFLLTIALFIYFGLFYMFIAVLSGHSRGRFARRSISEISGKFHGGFSWTFLFPHLSLMFAGFPRVQPIFTVFGIASQGFSSRSSHCRSSRFRILYVRMYVYVYIYIYIHIH